MTKVISNIQVTKYTQYSHGSTKRTNQYTSQLWYLIYDEVQKRTVNKFYLYPHTEKMQ